MGSVIAARGPDDEGLSIEPGVGLIHQRLSILDLSELGNCPMPNEDGSIRDGERTLFASSIHALLAYDEKPRPMNPDAIVCCLSHSFIPATHTVWNGNRRLSAGALWGDRW